MRAIAIFGRREIGETKVGRRPMGGVGDKVR
jgi:hypothetical protein